ncbi:alpha/beta hydrolase family protein [Cohnella nanjingensis]|uniref:Dienelactone hydrolase family protein n=1 Tax=Cohnella nanjingensis TaxID=1387779 RepID=A0A7X0VEX0_9BACL|nr:dienelactone hydrolase family protein [Cohnella nanjingensis]MBB6670014.1 dienelactone hydrolase family protein [Cohnella nanjingensis]
MDTWGKEGYQEPEAIGNRYREKQKVEFDRLVERMREGAEGRRNRFFRPDTSSQAAFERDAQRFRMQLQSMLGWPEWPPEFSSGGLGANTGSSLQASLSFVAEDPLGSIHRVELDAGYGLTTYGLLFLPRRQGPYPLVISQHGGWGTPELCSGFYGPSNYNGMTRRIWARGVAVFAPQLLLWDEKQYGPAFNRRELDVQLKQLGSSIAAVEIYKIRRSLDYLTSRDDIDAARVGMVGLSYGGFYTLFTAALDTRIKAVYSSCFINNRFVVDWSDFTWFNAGNTYLDAEVCALIAPRFLHVEAGEQDETFLVGHARREMDKVAAWYRELKMDSRFSGVTFAGGHELNPGDEGFDAFFRHLLA